MRPLVRYALIALVALAATTAGIFVGRLNQSPAPASDPSRDRALATAQLMALTLPNGDGLNQSLRQWQGKLLVVNFWATWCAPCREEMPGLSRLHDEFSAKGVQFVGIAFDSADKVREFSKQTPVSYPLLIGGSGLLPIAAGLGNAVGGLPFTVVLDRQGQLRQAHLGSWKESDLAALLVDLAK